MENKALNKIKGMWESFKAPTPPFWRKLGDSILGAALLAWEFEDELGLEKYGQYVMFTAIIMKFFTSFFSAKKKA